MTATTMWHILATFSIFSIAIFSHFSSMLPPSFSGFHSSGWASTAETISQCLIFAYSPVRYAIAPLECRPREAVSPMKIMDPSGLLVAADGGAGSEKKFVVGWRY